jgi:hypothetical protein
MKNLSDVMLKSFSNRISRSKGLLKFFVFSYLDKIISFALPLTILFFIKDNQLYASIEVAFSYAMIIMVGVELGFTNYLFYGYKHAQDTVFFLKQAKTYFKFLLLFYCVLSMLLVIGINAFNQKIVALALIVCVRILSVMYFNFYAIIYRLKDIPAHIFIITITINVLSFIMLFAASYFSWDHQLIYFFLPPIVMLFIVCVRYVFSELVTISFSEFFSFLKKAFSYSWPIMLNVLAMSFINNYAKIYAYEYLSQQDMVQISYIMRIGLVIQLTHVSFSSYFSKALFMDVKQKLNVNIFLKYSLVLWSASLLAVVIILATNLFFGSKISIPFNLSTFMFLFYIILWCYTAYLELYFGVKNANKRVLVYSLISLLTYLILLRVKADINLLYLSFLMVLTAVINLSLVIAGLFQLKVLDYKPMNIKRLQ